VDGRKIQEIGFVDREPDRVAPSKLSLLPRIRTNPAYDNARREQLLSYGSLSS